MKILILGPSGQIGHELTSLASEIAEVTTAGRTAAEVIIDPLDQAALAKLFSYLQPDIVINAIAYTAVDNAESNLDLAFQLNTDLPSNLADLCADSGCLLIHYSTDFVFDGTGSTAWSESAATNPLSVYGTTKLAGEKAIQLSACTSLILRTSWVYGERGSNFLLTMLRLARERKSLSVVDDQMGSPTSSREIAKATIALCQRYLDDPQYVKSQQGLYHLTSAGKTSWYGFAGKIFELAAEQESLMLEELLAISTDQYPTPAKRPAFSVLNNQRIKDIFDIELADWQESLQECINRYYQSR